MSSEFVTYQRFADKEDMQQLTAFLETNGVPYQVEDAAAGGLNEVLAGVLASRDFRLKLRQPDFERVDTLLQDYYREDLDSLPADYYLYHFTNIELMEVIVKRDEWGVLDFVLAQHLLQQNGIPVTEQYVAAKREQRLAELSQPERTGPLWVKIGYGVALLTSILSFAQIKGFLSLTDGMAQADLLGGIIGAFIGYSLIMKKTLPNGERVYAQDAKSRRHGKNILGLSIFQLVLWNICKLYIWYIA